MRQNVTFQEYEVGSSGALRKKESYSREVYIPDQCPMCGFAIAPIVFASYCHNNHSASTAVMLCPNCNSPFLASYMYNSEFPYNIEPKATPSRSFDQKIVDLSPQFVKVYNQALIAESNKLDEISGIGYRKAVEFLIKDYLIKNSPDSAETIRKESLGSSIKNIENDRLKFAASRAVWLGNDFTHYTRKFDDYEISDMKRFIDAVLHWILMELTTDEAESMDRR